MVGDKLMIVLPGFLKAQKEDDELLTPICSLHEVVAFQSGLQLPMRVIYELSSALSFQANVHRRTHQSKTHLCGNTKWAAGT